MTSIYQIMKFEDFKPKAIGFYKELQLTEEQIANRIKLHEERFCSGNFIYYLLEDDNEPMGFMVCEVLEDSIRALGIHVSKCDKRAELMALFIIEATEQMKALQRKDIT
ncbi:MAG: hypothetical protein ACTSQB_07635, partial [Candidatus Heimdallarchaeota archaeon]